MGKIAPVSAKYIIYTRIQAEGIVEKPDVIGAVFGQTEGLLGTELELRELQKSGRIGRIEVNLETKNGKTSGLIILPSSLDQAETSLVAASLETIQRIGPCNAKVFIENIEDVRVSKRKYVVERAKELLKKMLEKGPDTTEIMDEIKESVRALEIIEYGPDHLPAGPDIKDSEEIIVVEGRADVVNLLKNGFRNVIGLNGTVIPPSIADLINTKTATVFVDGDRGGDIIIRELIAVSDVDFVAKAPSGKEVEELTKKEIHKCLRARIPFEQYKEEVGLVIPQRREGVDKTNVMPSVDMNNDSKPVLNNGAELQEHQESDQQGEKAELSPHPKLKLPPEMIKKFKKMLEELIGTRGAYLLDKETNILGKVPVKELKTALRNVPEVSTIIMDGAVTGDILRFAESLNIANIVAMQVSHPSKRIKLISAKDLEVNI